MKRRHSQHQLPKIEIICSYKIQINVKTNAKNKQNNDCLKQALMLRTIINAWIRITKD